MRHEMLSLLVLLVSFLPAKAQHSYSDSLSSYRIQYMAGHEVVAMKDRNRFRFYEADPSWRVTARFQPAANTTPFRMESSGTTRQLYRRYGTLHFRHGKDSVVLTIYQSLSLMETEQFRYHLFLPFADATSGNSSYAGGRYLDLDSRDIRGGRMLLDFNKAYNPYCAYISGVYNCPVPPSENRLTIAVRAGEGTFSDH